MDVEKTIQQGTLRATYPANIGTVQGRKPISLKKEQDAFIPNKEVVVKETAIEQPVVKDERPGLSIDV